MSATSPVGDVYCARKVPSSPPDCAWYWAVAGTDFCPSVSVVSE